MQPGPFVPPPVTGDQQVRPPLWWFGVAAGIAVAGIIAAVVLIVMGVMRVTDRVDDFTRIDVPGSGTVRIDDPGGYSIYHEYFGASGGVGDPFLALPDVTVTDPSGDEVLLDAYDSDVTYDFGGHEGEAIYTFDADEAGAYEVTVSGESGTEIAVGPGLGRGLVAAIVGGIALGAAGVIGGGVLAIVTGVRRSRSRRMLVAARWAQGPAPSAWPGPPGGPGGPGGWGASGGPGAPGAPGAWGAPPGAGWGLGPGPGAGPGSGAGPGPGPGPAPGPTSSQGQPSAPAGQPGAWPPVAPTLSGPHTPSDGPQAPPQTDVPASGRPSDTPPAPPRPEPPDS